VPRRLMADITANERPSNGCRSRRIVTDREMSWRWVVCGNFLWVRGSRETHGPPRKANRRQRRVEAHSTDVEHHRLEQMRQDVALPEPAMTIAREGGVVGHPAVKSQATKPSIGEVEMEAVLSATSNSASIAACHSGDVVFGQPATIRCVVIEPKGEGNETTQVHVIVGRPVECAHRGRYDSAHNAGRCDFSDGNKVLIAMHFIIFSMVF
jgi:hypothetical protein